MVATSSWPTRPAGRRSWTRRCDRPRGGGVRGPSPGGHRVGVLPGECFWTIAEAVLAGRRGAPAGDADLVPYWLRLIAANRDRLVDRDNPDLIFPGQVFVVPQG